MSEHVMTQPVICHTRARLDNGCGGGAFATELPEKFYGG